ESVEHRFFFSSRGRHTRLQGDWSSDVCSSDLELNTIIVVTHDVTAAATVSDHMWLMGRDRDEKGEIIPGARIQETYDLIERDLCWHPDITSSPRFVEFVTEVKERFKTL